MAFLFAKEPSDALASLVKQLDKVVSDNADKKLSAVVNFIDVDEEEVKKFAEDNKITSVALTVTDQKNADRFQVNPEVDVTAMHYKGKKVLSNHAVAPGKLDKKSIKAILDGASTILE